jgi:hypothetical protein
MIPLSLETASTVTGHRLEGNSDEQGVLRGRADFVAHGRLRTKPGRADAETTRSMSCRFVGLSHINRLIHDELVTKWQNGMSLVYRAHYCLPSFIQSSFDLSLSGVSSTKNHWNVLFIVERSKQMNILHIYNDPNSTQHLNCYMKNLKIEYSHRQPVLM